MLSNMLETILQWALAVFVAFALWHVALRVYDAAQKPTNPINEVVRHLSYER